MHTRTDDRTPNHIIWVNDDHEWLRNQKDHILSIGYGVEIIPEVDVALEEIQRKKDILAGIILDVMMNPGETLSQRDHDQGLKTGLVVLEYLEELQILRKSRYPGLFIFTHRLDPDAARAIQEKGYGYHQKQDFLGTKIIKLVRDEFEQDDDDEQ